MNKRISFIILTISILTLACNLVSSFSAPTATPVPPTLPPPTATLVPTATTAPTDTPEPLPTPTLVILPQQWNGTYDQAGIGKIIITILIEKMDGDVFLGKMFWTGMANFRGAITRISGQFVSDFGDAQEQAMWGNHPDYRNGDRSGAWIKWTETEFVNGGGYTLGGWYYGHIVKDKMTGIYYQYFTKARNWRSLTPNLRQRAQTTRGFRDLLIISTIRSIRLPAVTYGNSKW